MKPMLSLFNIRILRFPSLIVIGALTIVCILMFHQLLFFGEIVNATDILTQQYFWNVFLKGNLSSDPCFRTWMPYINAGTPFGGGLNLLFRPIYFFTLLLLPVHIAISYEIVLYLIIMGVSMYFFMRELRLSYICSFLAALFMMLSGQIVSLVNAGHVNKLGTIAFTPLVFWALERALKRKTIKAFVITGVMLALQFWQTHIQISFYVCIAVGLYFLLRVGLDFRKERNAGQFSRLLVFSLLMVIIFLLLSAVEFLPWISFAQVSDRSEGVSYEFATSWSMPPEELVTYLIPGFFGFRRLNFIEDENIIPYWGRMPFTQTGHYFGLLPVLFMLLALCFVRNKHVLTLGILALVIVLLGMGKYFPPYRWLYDYVPGFNKFRVPQMILFLFAFAASALAGFGAEWLFSGWTAVKEKRLRIFLLAGIVVLMLVGLFVALFPNLESSLLSTFSEALPRKGATQDLAQLRLNSIYHESAKFLALFGLSLFALGLRLTRIRRRWLFFAVLLVFLVDIGLFNDKFIDTIPLEGSHYIDENDAIRYCKENPGLYRVLPMTNEPATYSVSNKFVLHKLASVSGYEAVGVQYYNDFLQQMALGTPLVDLLNIKYIILPKNVELDGEAVEVGKVVGPYKVVMDSDAVLLENLHVLPRAYAVHNAYLTRSKDEAFSIMLHPSFKPREFVVLEETPQRAKPKEVVPSSQSTVEITHYQTRTIKMRASMASDGFLVLSEKFYPGWKAYVDGKETTIYKADYTLQAVALLQGEHEVVFRFQPTQFRVGLFITLLTGVVLLGFAYFRVPVSRIFEVWRTHVAHNRRLVSRVKNVLLFIVSVAIALVAAEIFIRHSPLFQHGGDREPRNPRNLTWEKPEGIKRIVILGDSLTFGDGVKATETYPFKLQQKLDQYQQGRFQVLNLGIMGINTDQEAMILTGQNPYFGRPALDFDPDVLVLTVCINDIELMPDPKPRPETLMLPHSIHQYLRQHYRLYQFVHTTFNQLWATLGFQPSYTGYLQKLYSSETSEWKQFQYYLDGIIRTAQQRDIPFLLVLFPSLEQLDETHHHLEFYEKVAKIGRDHGVEVLDLFPLFQGKEASSFRVSLMNGHPNAAAYDIAAEAMYQHLINTTGIFQEKFDVRE